MNSRYWSFASAIILMILAALCAIGFSIPRLVRVIRNRLRRRMVNPGIVAAFDKVFVEK